MELKYSNFSNINIKFILIIIYSFFTNQNFAQGVSCVSATSITINGSCLSGSISDTTQDIPNIATTPTSSSCPTSTFRREGWYTFTVSGGPLNVTITSNTSDSNAFLQLISATSSCLGLAQIDCANNDNNSNSAQTESINIVLNSGTYYIKIVNVGNNNNMNLTSLCVTGVPVTSNDNCGGAINLSVNTNTTCSSYSSGTTIGASQSLSGCVGTADDDVWYRFVATSSSHTVTITPGTLNDAVFQVFSGSCSSLSSLNCIDNTLGSAIETNTVNGLTIGNTYYIRIYSYSNGSGQGTFSACITTPPNPCSSISSISNCSTAINVSIPSGNGAYGTSSCGYTSPGNEVIYSFTPTTTGDYSITQNSSFGYIDYMYKTAVSGCNSSGWTCIKDMNGFGTSNFFTLTAGIQYYFLLDPENNSGGNVNFTINCVIPPPSNNQCANAINLPCGTTNLAGSTVNTANYSHGTGCTMSNNGVWYTFAGDGNLNTIAATTIGYDIEMAITTGSCESLTNITCQDTAFSSGTESYTFNTTLGTVYRVYISHWDSSSSTTGTFTISRTCYSPPANDNCIGAFSLTVNPTSICNVNASGTSIAATESQAGCIGTADDDVWYSFTAAASSHIITVTPIGLSNAVFQVFSGNCSSLNSIVCINNTTGSSSETSTVTGLNIGNIYYVRVFSFSNGSDQGSFTICITTPCSFGSGNGVSSAGCPSNVTGGYLLNGADSAPINDCSASTCTNLEVSYLPLGQTTNYTVQTIPFIPPYQFDCLQNSVSINVDDVWSPIINIPFNFCFYGNTYNRCLIGSNGVLTFDLTNNSPGGYNAWAFSNNLPSTSLTLNTIFGVYHDIDPSKGGEVGWELVTMPTGCRALVASWSNIPMFSTACNNLLYTGMIVLYENTNIIEVYIKDKRVCATWNSGNAVVGVQNTNGTQAVVAPNRNSLDPDWNTSNEAWRFTPSGSSISTIEWYEGTSATGPILGTSNIINVCPNVTTTYTSKVTYTFCNGSTLELTDPTTITINNRKVWNGSVDTDWNKNNNWTPVGIPNGTDCVTIPATSINPIISGTSYNGLAGTLSVLNNAILTINSNNSITVTDWVNVQPSGTFLINNNSSLIQINNIVNIGNIIYKRNANVRTLDYVYWSSPVFNFNYNNLTSPVISGPTYEWNTTIANGNGGQGNWASTSSSIMTRGKGYIIRGPSSAPFNNTTPNILNGSFTGIPINGTFTVPISRGNDQNTALHFGTNGVQITNLSDNWNLLGNPYPSAIRGSQFLLDNNTKIEGNIRLWTHGNLPVYVSNPFYDSFVYNYTSGDYLTFNFTGASCCPALGSDLFIGAGQGFFVQMKDGPAGSDVVTFNNTLRSSTYDNSLFYRNSNSNLPGSFNINEIERNRIWLDIINPNGESDRTLFGYIENATMDYDSFFDCITQNSGGTLIYSLLDQNTLFSIQGRSLPFVDTDEVNIGINIPNSGNYSIAIAGIDGVFNTQNIYLKDTYLNVIHDIKTNPYHFNAIEGNYIDRFKIIYRDSNLGSNNYEHYNTIKVIVNNSVNIQSSNHNMDSVEVFNLIGQRINSFKAVNSNFIRLNNLQKNNTTLLLKIKLSTGDIVVRKIIY